MAWCRQATSHYLNQRWSRSLSPYNDTRPHCVNIGNHGDSGCLIILRILLVDNMLIDGKYCYDGTRVTDCALDMGPQACVLVKLAIYIFEFRVFIALFIFFWFFLCFFFSYLSCARPICIKNYGNSVWHICRNCLAVLSIFDICMMIWHLLLYSVQAK